MGGGRDLAHQKGEGGDKYLYILWANKFSKILQIEMYFQKFEDNRSTIILRSRLYSLFPGKREDYVNITIFL